jgi:hypothetical protein
MTVTLAPPGEEVARLREELAAEQRRSRALGDELKKHKELLLRNSLESEAEEECLINNFNKKLERLTAEKERLALEVEREEELISNTLLKQLSQLRKDKVDLENQMEQEQECMVNKLQRQVASLDRQRQELAAQLAGERDRARALIEDVAADLAPGAGADRLATARDKLARAHSLATAPVGPVAPLSPLGSPKSSPTGLHSAFA